MITLTLKEAPHVPLEAEALSPDVMATLSNDAIRALPVLLGKRQRRIGDFFDVEGEASEQLGIHGDAARIKWIGRGMTRGRITIAGNAGMHLGAYMSGGSMLKTLAMAVSGLLLAGLLAVSGATAWASASTLAIFGSSISSGRRPRTRETRSRTSLAATSAGYRSVLNKA